MKKNKILAIIPARAGSKGIPDKNIREIAGEPLICWTIRQALKSNLLDKVIVSTDGEKVADISRKAGADVPFMRPKEFAQDHSPTSDVVVHALKFFENQGVLYDMVAILEPTSPLRKSSDIDNGVDLLCKCPEADSLISVGEVHAEHPLIVKKIENNFVKSYIDNAKKIHQRQQADAAYFPYGVLYLARSLAYVEYRTFYTEKTLPLPIERWQNYEVDDEIDFVIIETLMRKYKTVIS